MMENNKPSIIHHRNEWIWGKSTICVTDDGYGIAIVSFITDYTYNEETGEFVPEKQAVISDVSVHTTRRNHGYGNLVLCECENEAAKNGYNEVYLWAVPGTDSYKWYKRNGYVETEQTQIIPSGYRVREEYMEEITPETNAECRLKKILKTER